MIPQKIKYKKQILFAFIFFSFTLYFLFPKDASVIECKNCRNPKLEPKLVLICFQFLKFPYLKLQLPYSLYKTTLFQCKKCKKQTWRNSNKFQNIFHYSNDWGNGNDIICPFCNGRMIANLHGDRECAADWYYECKNCKRRLILIHCIDQPISWAKSFFKKEFP